MYATAKGTEKFEHKTKEEAIDKLHRKKRKLQASANKLEKQTIKSQGTH